MDYADFGLEELEERRMLSNSAPLTTTTTLVDRGTLAEWGYVTTNGNTARFGVDFLNETESTSTGVSRAVPPAQTNFLAVSLRSFDAFGNAEINAAGVTHDFQEIDGGGFKSIELRATVQMDDAVSGATFAIVLDLTWSTAGRWTAYNDSGHSAAGRARFHSKSSETAQVSGVAIAQAGDAGLVAAGTNFASGAGLSGTIFQSTLVITTFLADQPNGPASAASALILS